MSNVKHERTDDGIVVMGPALTVAQGGLDHQGPTMQDVLDSFDSDARRMLSVSIDSTVHREPGRIIREVDGDVRFLAEYAGLMDYRAGRRVRVLRWRGQDCDRIVEVAFGRLRDLANLKASKRQAAASR